MAFLDKRRTKYEIYSDLLDIVARKGSCRLTRASYGANLPVDRAKKMLTFLASRGFLKEDDVGDSKIYKITKRGLEYLETFRQMRRLFAALDERIPPARAKPPKRYEDYIVAPRIHAKLVLEDKEVKAGEDIALEISLVNVGKTPALLTKIEGILPDGFELIAKPDYSSFDGTGLELGRRNLDQLATEKVRFTVRSYDRGTFVMAPRIIYEDQEGHELTSEPEPVKVSVVEAAHRKISTGYNDLDSLLLGGIPENYAIILTSLSCDERDLLIKKFLEAGAEKEQITFYVTIEASGVRKLAEKFQSNFYVFICNPQADQIIKSAPNIFKLKGVENLTDINIALTSALRTLSLSEDKKRACIEIISDVLLQHRAIQTRRWLTGLMPELRSRGFTTLAVMNPQMHTPQEVQAILGLFEGEINIYEKETKKGLRKHLRIKKMFGQRYLESEMPLVRDRLQI